MIPFPVTCPYCGHGFVNGRELKYHLTWPDPGCRSVEGESAAAPPQSGNKLWDSLVDLGRNIARDPVYLLKENDMESTTDGIDPASIQVEMQNQYDHYGKLLDRVTEEILMLENQLGSKKAVKDSLVRAQAALGTFLWPAEQDTKLSSGGMEISG